MAETALVTAFDESAPQDERADAMAKAQQAPMPSSVNDMLPLVEFMREHAEEQEFQKSLSKARVIPFPSRAVQGHKPGMQSVWVYDT